MTALEANEITAAGKNTTKLKNNAALKELGATQPYAETTHE